MRRLRENLPSEQGLKRDTCGEDSFDVPRSQRESSIRTRIETSRVRTGAEFAVSRLRENLPSEQGLEHLSPRRTGTGRNGLRENLPSEQGLKPEAVKIDKRMRSRLRENLPSEQGLQRQWSVISVSDQSAKRIMHGREFACRRMPTSDWIPWVIRTEMKQERRRIDEDRLQPQVIRLGELRRSLFRQRRPFHVDGAAIGESQQMEAAVVVLSAGRLSNPKPPLQ